MYSSIIFLFTFTFVSDGLRNHGCKFKRILDTDKPLFLTPLIENEEITRAQSLARVKHGEFQNVVSYAGYITVNKTHNSNTFFWYFPSESNSAKSPVVLWLNGGPGSTSLIGLFVENGPFYVKNNTIHKRKYTWTRNHNVIYVDNPVGTGFSFTENEAGYAKNELDVARDLYSFLVQFFQLFPSLQKNDLYAIGESYGGKYIPAVTYAIHQNNPDAKVKINLKGLAIGNGLCDPINQLVYGDYLYQLGLIDSKLREIVYDYEGKITKEIENQNFAKASQLREELFGTALSNLIGFNFFYNYLHTEDYTDEDSMNKFVQRADIKKAIHVGSQSFQMSVAKTVQSYLEADIMDSVAHWISELLSHYHCLFYNGQLDIRIPYPSAENFLRKLEFSADEEYKNAERKIWKVDGEIAGYSKVAGNLTEIVVRNAGHLVPMDQPLWSWDLVTRFTSNKQFD